MAVRGLDGAFWSFSRWQQLWPWKSIAIFRCHHSPRYTHIPNLMLIFWFLRQKYIWKTKFNVATISSSFLNSVLVSISRIYLEYSGVSNNLSKIGHIAMKISWSYKPYYDHPLLWGTPFSTDKPNLVLTFRARADIWFKDEIHNVGQRQLITSTGYQGRRKVPETEEARRYRP